MEHSQTFSNKLELTPEAKKLLKDNFLKSLKVAQKEKTLPEESLKNLLHRYILKNFKVNIPQKKVCPNHDAPFDFVYAESRQRLPELTTVETGSLSNGPGDRLRRWHIAAQALNPLPRLFDSRLLAY